MKARATLEIRTVKTESTKLWRPKKESGTHKCCEMQQEKKNQLLRKFSYAIQRL